MNIFQRVLGANPENTVKTCAAVAVAEETCEVSEFGESGLRGV